MRVFSNYQFGAIADNTAFASIAPIEGVSLNTFGDPGKVTGGLLYGSSSAEFHVFNSTVAMAAPYSITLDLVFVGDRNYPTNAMISVAYNPTTGDRYYLDIPCASAAGFVRLWGVKGGVSTSLGFWGQSFAHLDNDHFVFEVKYLGQDNIEVWMNGALKLQYTNTFLGIADTGTGFAKIARLYADDPGSGAASVLFQDSPSPSYGIYSEYNFAGIPDGTSFSMLAPTRGLPLRVSEAGNPPLVRSERLWGYSSGVDNVGQRDLVAPFSLTRTVIFTADPDLAGEYPRIYAGTSSNAGTFYFAQFDMSGGSGNITLNGGVNFYGPGGLGSYQMGQGVSVPGGVTTNRAYSLCLRVDNPSSGNIQVYLDNVLMLSLPALSNMPTLEKPFIYFLNTYNTMLYDTTSYILFEDSWGMGNPWYYYAQ